MSLVDNFKLRALIEESITSFKFLDSVKVQDDISSQLAGFEISKLLKNQQDNERRYAQLVKKRATLTKITQKQQLNLVQAQIAKLSMILKQSTKKLCKLFKENPDLQKDSFKVSRQRKALILKLQELIEFVKYNSTAKFQTFITHELESQDQMRRLMQKEKKLNMEIKKLQQQKMAESKEYQKEIAENMARIQQFKESLMDKSQKSEIQISYFDKETKAELSNKRRIFEQSEKAFSIEIENLKSSIKTETLVHKELEEYLHRKNMDIKKKSQELTTKTEQCKDKLDQEINELNELIERTNQELQIFKKRYQEEEDKKLEREKKERRKMEQRKNKEQELIRFNNAIKYIQNEYLAWKQAGGGKKKKKKK